MYQNTMAFYWQTSDVNIKDNFNYNFLKLYKTCINSLKFMQQNLTFTLQFPFDVVRVLGK